eukprot:557797-Amphidinium_carterae.1
MNFEGLRRMTLFMGYVFGARHSWRGGVSKGQARSNSPNQALLCLNHAAALGLQQCTCLTPMSLHSTCKS